MDFFSLPRLPESAVRHGLIAKTAEDCRTTAELLAFLGEFEARKLYVPDGYSSMHAYCTGRLHYSEDVASKRIDVAKTARQFPVFFPAIAAGRIHLSGVLTLSNRLTPDNVDELLAAASHKTRAQIEYLLACRFPRADLPAEIESLPQWLVPSLPDEPDPVQAEHAAPATDLSAPGRINSDATAAPSATVPPSAIPVLSAPGRITPAPVPPGLRSTVTPFSARKARVKTMVELDLLQRAQDLCSDRIPSRDVEQIFHLALQVLVAKLEKQKLAVTDRPRSAAAQASTNPRYIPAKVTRAVVKRDGGRCTFVSDAGHRCESRRVEFDHIQEVARGGQSTVANIRLRCRAHNQYEAERTYGTEFMSAKRQGVQRRAAKLRATAHAQAAAALAQVAAIVEREHPANAAAELRP